jgi:UDP-N-acetylmuramoyl-tripeptide--D-alanyl-D-alanine ligase
MNIDLNIIQFLALGLVLVAFQPTILKRLAFLQEKDYWRDRILADKRTFRISTLEEILSVTGAIVLINSVLEFIPEEEFLYLGLSLIALLKLGNDFRYLLRRELKRPQITLRILLNYLAVHAFLALTILTLDLELITGIITIVGFSFPMLLVTAANEISRQIVFIGHRKALKKASTRLQNIPELVTVGITGSYGKSTTKLFLNEILKKNYISTPGSINTDIGIATSINGQLDKLSAEKITDIDYAILEMDAYTRGTLDRVTNYFPLDIAVIMSINEQHLETFGGDIENTKKGNYEVIANLKQNGRRIAIFNADNKHCRDMAGWYREELEAEGLEPDKYIYWFGKGVKGVGQEAITKLDATFSEVEYELEPGKASISFKLNFSERLGGEEVELRLPVPAKFYAMNYTAAALIAKLLDTKSQRIREAAKNVSLKRDTLDIYYSEANDLEVINDTFNVNPESITGNLELLGERNQQMPAKNMIIFTGLFDLAEESEKIHAELGPKFAELADQIIITNDVFYKQIVADLEEKVVNDKFIYEKSLPKLKEMVDKFIDQDKPKRIFMINAIPAMIKSHVLAYVKDKSN